MLGVRQVGLGRPGRDELQPLRLDSPRAALRGHMRGVRRLRTVHMPPLNDHALDHRARRAPTATRTSFTLDDLRL